MSEAATLIDLRKSSKEDISQFLSGIGEKPFRAKQIHEWIWKKSATSIDDMTNLSLSTRDQLKAHFTIRPAVVDKEQKSNDGTIKSALKLYDNHLIESVLIPQDERMTACVSSQVGCSLSCKFCATGYMDRERNLDASEIYDQVVVVAKQAEQNFDKPLSNIVYMGMGEPLLNYKNVLESIDRITSPDGLNMSPKRITVSTAGIAKMIKKLADDQVKFNLALSLHAANDEKRNKIMPINESNTLEALREALNYFYKKTGNKITFEYILFYDFNDSLQDAKELYEFWKRVPARINIIEYNPIAEANYKNADADTLDNFTKYLTNKGVNVHVRRSRGKDIDAACGQLANKN
ncbi:MAG: 23S rRNA (adenine(2503)-C(2))-methyltransferase RlmN [Reichenbachiella sp.]|uniref:23S rRNA (adenine(2503)-C(2))-methyltransferase RlmN n=1 Tax=Reichenbachiella sp. TaxID=2184521 RepID=UPI003299731A